MAGPTSEEKARMADAPKGAAALTLVIAALLLVGWMIFYFGCFMSHGPVR